MTEIFEIDKGMEARNFDKLKRIVGEFGTAVEDGAKQLRNKWTKTLIGTGIAVAALGTAAYTYMNKNNKKQNTTPNLQNTKEIENNKLNKTA